MKIGSGSAPGRKPTTIRRRLLLTFGAVIALLSLFSLVIFSSIQRTHRFLSSMQDDLFGIEALSTGVDHLYAAADNYLHSGRAEYLAEYDRALKDCQGRVASLRARLPGDLHYKMRDIGNMVQSFDELKVRTIASYASGLEAIYVNRYLSELSRLRGYTRSECSHVLSAYMTVVDGKVGEMRAGLVRSEQLSYALLVFVISLSIFLALRLTREVSVPIHELVESLESFAEGKLDLPPLRRERHDEISALVESFNSMTQRIRGLVEDIRRQSELESELKRREIHSLELENALKQSELETLQARINPHFLFNTLNTIATLADLENAAKTKGAVDSLAILMRAQLDSARTGLCLREELQSAEHYLRIQEIRFGSRLRHEIRIEDAAAVASVPGMVVQPFVENAVIHGLEPLERGGCVVIDARREGDEIVIVVADDGAGFDPGISPEPGSRKHEGILNVSRRLELLYGRKSVFIESAVGEGTKVLIRIPLVPPRDPA
jgi:two-component system, sensor histidine kinase YesM